MSEPRLKPKMDAPKVSGRINVVRDARDILTSHYKAQAAERLPGKERNNPKESGTDYAMRKVEKGMDEVKEQAAGIGRRTVRNYKEMSKRDKARRAQNTNNPKTKLMKKRAEQQRERSPHRLKTKGESVKQGSAGIGKSGGKGSRIKTANALKRKGAGKVAGGQAQNAIRQQAQKLAKQAAAAAKKVAKLLIEAAKALVRGIMALAAACTPLVAILVAVAFVAAIIASPLGIFFSGADGSDGQEQIKAHMEGLAGTFNSDFIAIVEGHTYDEMRLGLVNRGYAGSGGRADNLIDVIAVYAVKTADPDTGQDVVTVDPERLDKLTGVFWDMVLMEYEIKNEPKPNPDTGQDEDYYVLYIDVELRSAWEMADTYGFTGWQREILEKMLSGEMDTLYSELLGQARLFGLIGDGNPPIGTGNFIWPSPVSNYVKSPFGNRPNPWGEGTAFHRGIDISAGEGTPVLASDGGTVIKSEWHYSWGYHVQIDHGNGYKTLYAHNSSLLVAQGDSVAQGDTIALVGNTGESKGNHIHFEVEYNGTLVDPLQFFSNYTEGW